MKNDMEKYILDFAKENADLLFSDTECKYENDYYGNDYIWEQLRCLVTSLFLMENYTVDTKESDDFMLKLYAEFCPTVSFESFERFMYRYLV